MPEILFIEKDADSNPTGRRVRAWGKRLKPMAYADLLHRNLRQPSEVRLQLEDVHVLESTLDELATPGICQALDTSFTTEHTCLHLALMPGGWLPAGLALHADMLVFPDRCTLSELRGRFRPGRPARMAQDFIDTFNTLRCRVNPILLALEGNTRAFPSAEQVEAQLVEAADYFTQLLPNAQVIGREPEVVAAVIGMAESQRDRTESTMGFLLTIAPLLAHPISRARMDGVLAKIVSSARNAGLPAQSLALLCALSAAATTGKPNPALQLLKMAVGQYSREDAYNAASDLRSLEVFALSAAAFPNERSMLCTGDKPLALVWAGLRPSHFTMAGSSHSYKLSPLDEFMPLRAREAYVAALPDAQRCNA